MEVVDLQWRRRSGEGAAFYRALKMIQRRCIQAETFATNIGKSLVTRESCGNVITVGRLFNGFDTATIMVTSGRKHLPGNNEAIHLANLHLILKRLHSVECLLQDCSKILY
ncbi:hypothetical protein O6H91_02G107700 [Diphasiastrum complanatum]|uniref:Uncharacterized protein n=1 Tax=Diphasiastrum complanatum TaxID=34168 RepID=A0ACC2EIU9_DIPCM|nr:hypothetical protein O6H91_02G107700 [Diphasiastrum complanatum]